MNTPNNLASTYLSSKNIPWLAFTYGATTVVEFHMSMAPKAFRPDRGMPKKFRFFLVAGFATYTCADYGTFYSHT